MILIVDDNHIVRQATVLTVRYLLGFDTDEAADGFAALEKVRTTDYAAIVMDCEMPGLDGFECASQIRQLEGVTGSRTPIIGMTASVDRAIRENCLKAGMDDYLDKSCTNEQLRETLVKWAWSAL